MEGSLVDTRAYQPYTLAGPTGTGLIATPSTTNYIFGKQYIIKIPNAYKDLHSFF